VGEHPLEQERVVFLKAAGERSAQRGQLLRKCPAHSGLKRPRVAVPG
jgi:hypothetical protein